MSKKIDLSDEKLQLIRDIFQDSANGSTRREMAEKYAISPYTVDKYLAKAREVIYQELIEHGQKYKATVFAQYEYIYREAREMWKETKDVNYLKAMQTSLAKMSELLGLNAPPKAAVGEKDTDKDDIPVFIMDDSAYKAAEEEHKKLYDGTNKILDLEPIEAITEPFEEVEESERSDNSNAEFTDQ